MPVACILPFPPEYVRQTTPYRYVFLCLLLLRGRRLRPARVIVSAAAKLGWKHGLERVVTWRSRERFVLFYKRKKLTTKRFLEERVDTDIEVMAHKNNRFASILGTCLN